MRGVVVAILLEEYHGVAALPEGAAESTPERRVSVSPRRTNRQAEDDQLHGDTRAREVKCQRGRAAEDIRRPLRPAWFVSAVVVFSMENSLDAISPSSAGRQRPGSGAIL